MNVSRRLKFVALNGMLALAASGCNALSANHSAWEKSNPLADTAVAGPYCTVELHGGSAKTLARRLPLENETCVQEALQKSGALKKFGRMDIEIVRTSPKGTQHKMTVVYDRSKRIVEPQNNYQLFPGDVIIVTEDTSTILDDVFSATVGPMGKRIAGQIGG